jgi:hypothetical protein
MRTPDIPSPYADEDRLRRRDTRRFAAAFAAA